MKRTLFLLILVLAPLTGQALTIAEDTRWQGELRFAETVHVQKGATLTVAPGTTVFFSGGGLEVAGRLVAKKASFDGRDWAGVTLRAAGESVIEESTVRAARTGLLVLGGAPQLSGLEICENEVGIELRQQTAAELKDCRIHDNRKVGLFVKDQAVPVVTGCRFERNGRFGAYIYRATPGRFQDNLFMENPTALMIAYFGSDPQVRGNRFENNEIAIAVDRAARPTLAGNLVSGNRTGLLLKRRADARVRGNRIVGNAVGILVEYSSYPLIRDNDLGGNSMALRLNHQSSAWERENGADVRDVESAGRGAFGQGARGRVLEAQRRPQELTGTVDAKQNWWGEAEMRELLAGGGEGNPSFVHDGRDEPAFVDSGKSYPLDVVEFSPWREKPPEHFDERKF